MMNPLKSLLIPAALLASACSKHEEPVPTQTTENPIVNGQREPRIVPLTEGQKLAIGWLHHPGQESSIFCTGTLITPRVVITAQHCTEGERASTLGFGVGLMPNDPEGTFQVAELHEHPDEDAAILVLDRDVTTVVPSVTPIAANLDTIPQSLIGQQVEASGYGETYDASREGRYFALVRLASLTSNMLIVDGEGREGICFGDSGGPAMAVVGGEPRVLGVEHGGDDSCVGIDSLTRLDIISDWITDVIGGELPDPDPDPDPDPTGDCGDVDYLGRCDGNVAVWCEDGALASYDCGEDGYACGWVDDESGFFCMESGDPDPVTCDGIPGEGFCDGNVRVVCTDGEVEEIDCGLTDETCDQSTGVPLCVAGDDPDPVGGTDEPVGGSDVDPVGGSDVVGGSDAPNGGDDTDPTGGTIGVNPVADDDSGSSGCTAFPVSNGSALPLLFAGLLFLRRRRA